MFRKQEGGFYPNNFLFLLFRGDIRISADMASVFFEDQYYITKTGGFILLKFNCRKLLTIAEIT